MQQGAQRRYLLGAGLTLLLAQHIVRNHNRDIPVPMKIEAVVGAGAVAEVWKGVAVELGSDRSVTFTGRCRRRCSVNHLAYRIVSGGVAEGSEGVNEPLRRMARLSPLVGWRNEGCGHQLE